MKKTIWIIIGWGDRDDGCSSVDICIEQCTGAINPSLWIVFFEFLSVHCEMNFILFIIHNIDIINKILNKFDISLYITYTM